MRVRHSEGVGNGHWRYSIYLRVFLCGGIRLNCSRRYCDLGPWSGLFQITYSKEETESLRVDHGPKVLLTCRPAPAAGVQSQINYNQLSAVLTVHRTQ